MRLYLDYNASAPITKDSLLAMKESLKVVGNPSSVHKSGRQARSIIENSRDTLKELLNANNHQITFTSGATESNILALSASRGIKTLVSSIEHPSVLNNINEKVLLPVDKDGKLSLDSFEKIINENNAKKLFVSVMAVNNETGVIQPTEDIIKICKNHDVIVHVDAVQAIGREKIDMSDSFWRNIDMLTMSSHKIGGPKGVGCLLYNSRVENLIEPIIKGGGQERGRRAGTEAVQLIAGFGAASEQANKLILNKTKETRDLIEKMCLNVCHDSTILGINSPRISNTSNIAFKNIKAENLVIALDLEGYEVSSGSACSSGKISDSHVIRAMGLDESIIKGSIRISLCSPLNLNTIKKFVKTLHNLVSKQEKL